MFFEYLFTDFQYFFWWITIVLFSVCLHELFHALAAYWQGDDTAKAAGYFTLNPMIHMGPASLIILVLFGLCWGACPVNPSRFRHRYSEAIVSFAGPFANLLLVGAFSLATVLSVVAESALGLPLTVTDNLGDFFRMAAMLNAALFLLNMIPLPPLDGHSVVQNFIPQTREFYARLGMGGFAILFLLLWLPLGVNEAFWGLARDMAGAALLLSAGLFTWMLF